MCTSLERVLNHYLHIISRMPKCIQSLHPSHYKHLLYTYILNHRYQKIFKCNDIRLVDNSTEYYKIYILLEETHPIALLAALNLVANTNTIL